MDILQWFYSASNGLRPDFRALQAFIIIIIIIIYASVSQRPDA